MRLTATTTSAPAPQPPPFPLSCSSSSDPQQRAQPPPPPSSLLLAQLTTVKNARDLSSAAPHVLAPGILFRSACPAGCSERDVAVLRGALGVRTLLDLRSDEELVRRATKEALEIADRLGRTETATRQYLTQSRKHIAPFIEHCLQFLAA